MEQKRSFEVEQGTFDNDGDIEYAEPSPQDEVLGFDVPSTMESQFGQSSPPKASEDEWKGLKRFAENITPMTTSDGTMTLGRGGEEALPGEDIDEQKHAVTMLQLTDAVALGTARALAGAPAPARTQTNVGGYLGTRNVENGDILNSSATGTARSETGAPVPLEERKGDAFAQAKDTHNTTTDTLRPTAFGIAPANAVIPSRVEQVKSDVLFSDFSVVAPGNGLGVTNKMFQMETWRDKNFVFKEPLAEPRSYQGPTLCVDPPPLQWQNEITRKDRHTTQAREYAADATGVVLERRAGEGSLNTLGDDYGLLRGVSDKGLKRARESPLEPIILTPKAWERVKLLPGFQLERKDMRRLFDADRYPEKFTPHTAMEGGMTMSKRNALAVYPFPITSH